MWKDGQKVFLPRQRLRLKNGSIPSDFKNCFKDNSENCNNVLGSKALNVISVENNCNDNSENCNNVLGSKALNVISVENNCNDNSHDNAGPTNENDNSIQSDKASLKVSKTYVKRDLSPISTEKIKIANDIMALKSPISEGGPEISPYTKELLINDWNLRNVGDFPKYWAISELERGVVFGYMGDTSCTVTRAILVNEDMSIELRAHNSVAKYPMLEKVTSLEALRLIMIKVVCLKLCEESRLGKCKNGFFLPLRSDSNKCKDCQIKSKCDKRNERVRAQRLLKKQMKHKRTFNNVKQKLSRATLKIKSMEKNLEDLMDRYSSVEETALSDAIKNLPIQMQEVVTTIHKYGQTDNKKGMRYTKRWVLECLLLSIKSRKAYLHLRDHNILPLPTLGTLKTYLKNMKPQFGFDPQVFKILQKKGASMKPEEKRGTLVLDEMQISKAVSFDEQNLSVLGFTDLGDYTPEHQKKERGDHALVFMYQPFRGQWVQNIAAFLSKGAANGEVLSHLVAECITHLENHGFHVDVVTSDGATWNRGMWKQFGLKKLESSCPHISSINESDDCPKTRRLWFCSDFSHLVKNLRNFMMAGEEVLTPDGVFKKKHFRAVIKCDGGTKTLGLKIAHKLTTDHLDPPFFQKMHVYKAFELFSANVATAMQVYKETESDLHDCDPTIKVINKVGDLITAMTSRCSQNALSEGNKSYKSISEFREYLQLWKEKTQKEDTVFMSDNTYEGLMVTLGTAVELMDFLCKECGYNFLMTARLNQDALEGMFGMIRGCCGSTDKPEPLLFLQVYRLLSFYSLVKPPKGSNVKGLELFETLLSTKDAPINENKEELNAALDIIIERGENNKPNFTVKHEHNYNVYNVNEVALCYFSGFIARKVENWTSCQECIDSLNKCNSNLPREQMINSLSRGYLKYPSDILYALLHSLECAILQTVGQEQLNFYTFQHILQNILAESITFVGCSEHQENITKSVINYYAIVRTKIICKKFNKIYNDEKKKEQKLRKMSKLLGKKDAIENYVSNGKVTQTKNNLKGAKRKYQRRKPKVDKTTNSLEGNKKKRQPKTKKQESEEENVKKKRQPRKKEQKSEGEKVEKKRIIKSKTEAKENKPKRGKKENVEKS